MPVDDLVLGEDPIVACLTVLWLLQAFFGPLKAWLNRVFTVRQRERFQQARQADAYRPRPAALVIAAKGINEDFDGFLDLVLHQDYPDYRILFVTETDKDPAALAVRGFLGLSPAETEWVSSGETGGARRFTLVTAGLSRNEGQKVHNQRAAFRQLREGDEIIAFADADIIGSRGWLAELLTPLNLEEAELSTGYRWFLPKRPTLANWTGTNINGAVALLAGPSWHALLWGGSMAMTREAFAEIDVAGNLEGSLNDDLLISHLARRSGKSLFFVRSLMAPSPVDHTWGSLFEFARRQYFQVRIYTPVFWWIALTITSLWLAGVGVTWWRVFQRDWGAFWVIGLVGFMGLLAWWLRGLYLREQFPPEVLRQLKPARSIAWFTTTFCLFLQWLMILSAALIREIDWAGIRYRVRGRHKVEVLSRN